MKGETHVLRICTLVHQSMQRPYMRRCFRVRESCSVFHFLTFASTHRIPTRRPSAPMYRRTHTERSRTDQPTHSSAHRCERICYRCRLTVCFVQYGPISKVTRIKISGPTLPCQLLSFWGLTSAKYLARPVGLSFLAAISAKDGILQKPDVVGRYGHAACTPIKPFPHTMFFPAVAG